MSIEVKQRRTTRWSKDPRIEDYALRYAPRSFRQWSSYAVAMAALGGIAYLADFAIGASVTLTYGFTNALWAILAAGAVIFLTGWPIAMTAARHNVDMDLLTRGAGFGYLGSTITSIIYAAFTFIYFSTEGSIMGQALTLMFGLPIGVSYLICALLILPMVIYGMTFLSKLQKWTQPLWLAMLIVPLIAVLVEQPQAVTTWIHYPGKDGSGAGFVPLYFGLAAGVVLSLITQIGEQVDYLRFMPQRTEHNRRSWLWAVILAGPGWVLLGVIKQLIGSLLAVAAVPSVGTAAAGEPIQQVNTALQLIFPSVTACLILATVFVVLSQVKINVTNAYSGSLSWSNFFSRLTHHHPGRIVWLFLNVAIALALMEFGVFGFLNFVLGFYSNVAVAWIGAVVADLVINKPLLKLSPPGIEFRRGYLYNFNPVGFGSMIVASAVSITAFFGTFGATLAAFSPFLSLVFAFVLSPLIALVTKGKYYLARSADTVALEPEEGGKQGAEIRCSQCGYAFEREDMLYCPFHDGPICSLCCSLDATCHDMCKRPQSVLPKPVMAQTAPTFQEEFQE